MGRDADSLQVIWQTKFQEYHLNPFLTDPKAGLRYQRLDNPATWWFNPLNFNSLRLTRPAFNMLSKQTDVPKWKFDLPQVILPKTLLQLEKYFTSPYFINMKTIWVFGETESIMLALHGNNLQQYLDNHDESN